MGVGRQIVGGIVGGVLGAGIWAGVTSVSGYEIGAIAWGVGVLVGIGVASAGTRGTRAGVVAAVVAAVAVLGGKAGTAAVVAMEMGTPQISDELLISYVADEVVLEFQEAGRPLDYPLTADYEMPDAEGDYPPDVWEMAEARWMAMRPDQRAAFRSDIQAGVDQMAGFVLLAVLLSSIGLLDIVWLGLAITSAYKIAATPSAPSSADTTRATPAAGDEPVPAGGSQALGGLPMIAPPDAPPAGRPLSSWSMPAEEGEQGDPETVEPRAA